jgi:hypothetical protein
LIAVIDLARREGLSYTAALINLVSYALDNRPPHWRS